LEDQPQKVIRADRWLKNRFPDLSQAQVAEAIEAGLVVGVDGRHPKKGDKALDWDCGPLLMRLALLHRGNPDLEVPIVHTGEGYVVVDKPAGMPGHPLHLLENGTLTHWALAQYPESRKEFPDHQPILVPHRLDTGTSGLQIVCLTRAAFDLWRERFVQKRVAKTYIAWCWGKPTTARFEVNYGLAHLAGDMRRMAVPSQGDKVRGDVFPAQSICKVLEQKEDRFLVQVECGPISRQSGFLSSATVFTIPFIRNEARSFLTIFCGR